MNRQLPFFALTILFLLVLPAQAAINGEITTKGEPLNNAIVTLSKVNITQDNAGTKVYSFQYLTSTNTDSDGKYEFTAETSDLYRVNVTYQDMTFGRIVHDDETVNFNLSGTLTGYLFHFERNDTLAGVPVNLWDEDGLMIGNISTDDDGTYTFENVDTGNYTLSLTYQGVWYAEAVEVSKATNTNFTVYDSTDDERIISASVDHIILSKAPRGILVQEYVEFRNEGNRVFYSPERVWLGISTPQPISSFQTDVMECCLIREKDGAWIDPMQPIMPGENYSTQISYIFNPPSEQVSFETVRIYNTTYLSILSDKNSGLGIESSLASKEMISEQGKTFEVISFKNMPMGQPINIQITGYTPTATGNGESFNYVIPVLAVLLIGVVVYPILKSRRAKKTGTHVIRPTGYISRAKSDVTAETISNTDAGEEMFSDEHVGVLSFDALLGMKNSVFENIMKLENEFNAGSISEKQYKDLKKEYQNKAIVILKQLKDAASTLNLSQPVPILEKIIARIDDVNILENLLKRETQGANRKEVKELIERRMEIVEHDE